MSGTPGFDALPDVVKNLAAELMVTKGLSWQDAVRQAETEHPEPTTTDDIPRRAVTFTRASDVRTRAVDWLLDCWVPRGSVTLLGGREGIGKSTIAVDWAAQATRGDLTGTPMNVAYVVTEDSIEDTVVPRLQAAGADLARVMFLTATVPDPDDPTTTYESSLDLPGDYPILQRFIRDQGVGLVVLDAAKSVMSSKLKGNDDLDIRRFLEPMHRVAHDTGCTFVCLVHFSAKKGSADTGNLIMGSSAWQQVARSVVAVAEDKDAGTVKVWNSKANLASRIRTMEAQIVSAEVVTDDGRRTDKGRINWIGECDEDGSALLVPDADRGDVDDRTDAEVWLEDYLKQYQPCPRKDVLADAAKARVASEATIKRAFKKLGGVAEHKGFPRAAHWSLPSRLTGVPTAPVPLRRDPTEPTGPDQGKRHDPTEAKSPVGSPHMAEPTGADRPHLTAVPDTDPVRAAVLDALDDTGQIGVSEGALMRTVREITGSGTTVPDVLDTLTAEGIIRQTNGRYYRERN